jgi:sugar phosphate isomerase/epimerase
MKFGICCGVESARRALELGAEYVELGAVSFNGLQPEWDPLPFVGLAVETTNVFFPGAIQLFGPERTPYEEYAQRAIERAAEVGVRIMVVGSGGSRKAPHGSNLAEMDAAFADIVANLQRIADPYGIAMAPESLTRLETNVGNDLGRLARLLRERGVAYTADSFHVLKEWDFEHPGSAGPTPEHWADQLPFAPAHIHIGDLPRDFPKASDPMMQGFAKRVKELGYDERISLECSLGELEAGLPTALKELHALFD